jgi:hypothetical protein
VYIRFLKFFARKNPLVVSVAGLDTEFSIVFQMLQIVCIVDARNWSNTILYYQKNNNSIRNSSVIVVARCLMFSKQDVMFLCHGYYQTETKI